MARRDYGYMAKIGVDGSGMAAGLKEIDEILSEFDGRLKTTEDTLKNVEIAGGDTSAAMEAHLDNLNNAIEHTNEKFQALSDIQDDMLEALNAGAINTAEYDEYNNVLAETAAKLQALQGQYDALAYSVSEEAKAEKEAADAQQEEHDAVLSYDNELKETNETIQANQSRLAALRAEREAGRGSVTADIESHKVYREALVETEAKLKDLESRQKEVAEAFKNGTISADEYSAFQKELADTANEFNRLKTHADDAGQSTLQLGDIIKADLISSAIKTGLNALVDALRNVAEEAKEVVVQAGAMGDTIDKQAQRLGMSNEAYQEWRYILSQNGADISTLTTSMRTLTNKIEGLESGAKTATSAFKKLGLSYKDLEGKSGEEQFALVVQRLQMIDDETQRNAVANDVLGRSYQQLIPLLNQDADSIEALRQKAHDTNQIMSDEAVDAAVKYTEAMDTLDKSLEGFKNRIGAEILPGVTMVVEGFTDLLNGVDGADEKIQQGIDDIIAAADRVLPAIEDIVERIGEAAGDKAPDIIRALTTKITEKLPEVATAFLQFADVIRGAITEALPDIGKTAGSVVVVVMNSILDLLSKPETLADTLNAFVLTGEAFCEAIADGVMHYDWGKFTERLLTGLADTFDTAQKYVRVWMDNTFSEGSLYGGDVANVANSEFWEMYRRGAEEVVDYVDGVTTYAAEKYDKGKQILAESFDIQNSDLEEAIDTSEEVMSDYAASLKAQAEEWSEGAGDLRKSVGEITDVAAEMEQALQELDHRRAVHKISEEQYWAERKAILEKYRDEESEDWWKYYDKVTEYYDKAAENEKKAQEKAQKELEKAQREEEKAAKEAARKQKEALEEAYTAIETEQYKKGYDDGWRLDRQKEYLDTLDEESALYKEYYAKWLKDTTTFDKKVEDAYEKEYKKLADAGKKAAEAHLKEYEAGIKDILKAVDKPQVVEALTNPLGLVERRTGDPSIDNNKKKKQRLILSDYKSKIAELKEYQKNLDKLGTLGLSKAHLQEIFEMDFDTRALYIKELLQMSAAQRSKYLKDYEQYTQMAGTVSDKEMQYKAFEIVDSMGEALDKATDNAYVKGQEAAEAYYSGYKDYMKNTDLEDIDLDPYTGGYETEHKRNATIKALTDTAMSASAGAFDAIKGNLTINVAGKAAITATIGDLLKKLKNSGGVIDV